MLARMPAARFETPPGEQRIVWLKNGTIASNRSRKRLASFAPLGHCLSGGLFFAQARLEACSASEGIVNRAQLFLVWCREPTG